MFSIGSVTLTGRLVLAPLAGYSDLPFRLLCRQYGAALCVTEMVSAHGIVYRQPATTALLASCEQERPVAFQLFGADPAIMAEATAEVNRFRPDIIDINMGCPVKKVTKRGAGAALMTDPVGAAEIIRAVVDVARCPVTVKFRSGPDQHTINAVTFAKGAEDAGAAAVTVHGRTWKQGFSGLADWQIVQQVKRAIRIPVIGNGDVASNAQAVDRLTTTGCDAVMIGRAALGNPWVFSAGGRPRELSAIITGVQAHLSLIKSHGDQRRLAAARHHLGAYIKGFPGASRFRAELYRCHTWSQLTDLLTAFATDRPACSAPTPTDPDNQ